jgi:hypothetical protein
MKADYLTLANDRKVRIMWNMNAFGKFTQITGKEIIDFGSKVPVNMLRTIAWCSAIEGEKADGKELNLSEEEFGRLITMTGIVEFSAILTDQGNNTQKKNHPKNFFQKIHFRKMV